MAGDGEQRESEGLGDRLQGWATWVIVIAALVVVIGLVLFFIFDLGPSDEATSSLGIHLGTLEAPA